MHITVLNGPNLNLLGEREPGLYGATTLAEIEDRMRACAKSLHVELTFGQYNGEGELVTAVQEAHHSDGLILNAAAYTHSSIALRDAVLAIKPPVWGVHLTDPSTREPFRHQDYLADVLLGQTVGMGPQGYLVALESLTQVLRTGP